MAQTTFVGKKNPFTGAVLKPINNVDPSKLTIANDPLPAHRSSVNKYAEIIAKLKPGQCIKCPSSQVEQVANALRKHYGGKEGGYMVRLTKDYGDGFGRVWLLKTLRTAA